MAQTLLCEDPDSSTEWNLQLLPCLWKNLAKDSKTVSFVFEINSLELVLSKLTSVLEWNAASLAITSKLLHQPSPSYTKEYI